MLQMVPKKMSEEHCKFLIVLLSSGETAINLVCNTILLFILPLHFRYPHFPILISILKRETLRRTHLPILCKANKPLRFTERSCNTKTLLRLNNTETLLWLNIFKKETENFQHVTIVTRVQYLIKTK